MPMDWRRAEGEGLAIRVSVKTTECPGAHRDVTIALCGDDSSGRNHGDVRLILAVLNSYRIQTWLRKTGSFIKEIESPKITKQNSPTI